MAAESSGPFSSVADESSGHGRRSPTTTVVTDGASAIEPSGTCCRKSWSPWPSNSLTKRTFETARPAASRPMVLLLPVCGIAELGSVELAFGLDLQSAIGSNGVGPNPHDLAAALVRLLVAVVRQLLHRGRRPCRISLDRSVGAVELRVKADAVGRTQVKHVAVRLQRDRQGLGVHILGFRRLPLARNRMCSSRSI